MRDPRFGGDLAQGAKSRQIGMSREPLGRVNLAQESLLKEVLDVPPPIEDTMDVDRC